MPTTGAMFRITEHIEIVKFSRHKFVNWDVKVRVYFMQGRFSLTTSPRLKRASEVPAKSPKKRSVKRTPTKSPTIITQADVVESTPSPKGKTGTFSPYQTQQPVVSQTIKQKPQKKDPRRELEEEYTKLARAYSQELERREELTRQSEELENQIENQKRGGREE